MSKREQETRKNEEPENNFFPHSAVQGNDEGIVDAAHFAKAWLDQRTIAIWKEEEPQDQAKDESRKHAIIEKVAQLEAPLFRNDKQRTFEMAFAGDCKSEAAKHEHLKEACYHGPRGGSRRVPCIQYCQARNDSREQRQDHSDSQDLLESHEPHHTPCAISS